MTFNREGWTEKATPVTETGRGFPAGARVWGYWKGGEAAFIYLAPDGRIGGHAVGLNSVGGSTLDEAALSAERSMEGNREYRLRLANGSWGDADRRMTRKQVAEFLAT